MNSLKIYDMRSVSGDAAFLLDNGRDSVLYDTGFGFTGAAIANNIKKHLGERSLDAILLSHSHYDHVLATPHILKAYPGAKVIAGEYAARIFEKPSARAVMRDLDKKFAATLGISQYEDLADMLKVDITVSDGDTITFGDLSFKAVALPGHTKCSYGFYMEDERLLLSSETLGVYDGDRSIIPSFLVGYRMTLDSIQKAKDLHIERILLPHLGLIDPEKTKFYLDNAKKSAVETCREVATLLKFGRGKDAAFEHIKNKFYKGEVTKAYPIDAFTLNTSIMIDLIECELLT